MNTKKNMVTDATILAFVKCVTMFVSIIQTMILARTLSKTDYGTYSQALLVVSFLGPFFSLGLENTINYFYNRSKNAKMNKSYIDTIFTLSLVSGVTCGFIIIGLKNQLGLFFDNSNIKPLIMYIAFRPCLQNLIALYQPMYISSGYVRIIAVRNLLISIIQIIIVGWFSYFYNNISLILLLLLLLDIVQFIYFTIIYRKKVFKISMLHPNFALFGEILKYSLPMFFSISIGTISTNIDKLVVSGLMTIEDYALYSNVSKELPFSFIINSFTTVITPFIIKFINNNKKDKFKKLWSFYLEIGYRTTWPLCFGAFLLAPELIKILYSDLYLTGEGIVVFRLYIIVAMFRFTYFGIVPTAIGRTDIIMKYSLFGCLLNLFLNYPMFYLLGMLGPAVARIISMIVSAIFYFRSSIKLVDINISEIIASKKIIIFIVKMVFCGTIARIIVSALENYLPNMSCSVALILGYLIICMLMIGIDYKNMKSIVEFMNNQLNEILEEN